MQHCGSCINRIEDVGLPKSYVRSSRTVGLGKFLGLFTAWYYDGGLLYTTRSCLWKIMRRTSNRQGAWADWWHAPYSTGWEVRIFSVSFSFSIVRLSLSGLAGIERNERTVSVRVIHFGLFAHHLYSLYIQQATVEYDDMQECKRQGKWWLVSSKMATSLINYSILGNDTPGLCNKSTDFSFCLSFFPHFQTMPFSDNSIINENIHINQDNQYVTLIPTLKFICSLWETCQDQHCQ